MKYYTSNFVFLKGNRLWKGIELNEDLAGLNKQLVCI